MNDELECASVAQPHGREVPDVSRRQAMNAEIFSEHHDRRVNEAQAVAMFVRLLAMGARTCYLHATLGAALSPRVSPAAAGPAARPW